MDIQHVPIRDANLTSSAGTFRTSGSKPSLFNGLFRDFDRHEQKEWFEENWTISLYFVALYVFVIYYGQEFMKNRKPFQLNRLMVVWNFALAIFSIMACTRVLPEFYDILKGQRGFYKSVCSSVAEVTDIGLYWGWLFTLSKIIELGDTVFLILRKRNLIFLHWYHHITVLMYCWYSYSDQISPARWFICVNYSIHAMMYSYYALRSLNIKIPKKIAMAITTLQLSQMVIGVTVNVYAYRMKQAKTDCAVSFYHLDLGLGMYASYFLLFAHFFHKAYLQKDKRSRSLALDLNKKLPEAEVLDENCNVRVNKANSIRIYLNKRHVKAE